MPFHPTDDHIEWHMRQLRNWMIPSPMPIPQPATPRSTHAIPQHFYTQNVPTIDYYNYDTSAMTLSTHMPLQRAQTFADLNDFDYDYTSTGYFHSPMTPSSCPPEDLGVSDDVASCFSEAPSSFVSSDMTDRSGFESTHTTTSRHPSVTSQPAPALLQPPSSEVDALMKNIQPSSTGTSPASTASSASRVKRHMCPYSECGKAFSQPTHLKIHLRSHTGEKPYTCSVPTCRQAFSQLGNLRTHERRHIGQRPNRKRSSSDPGSRTKRYECILDGCGSSRGDPSRYGGKVFTQLGNLKAHMNKFHKDTLTRLSQQFAHAEATPEDQELRQYFQDLFKNSNKGIKGRGKGRKVEVLIGDVIQP